MDAKYHQVSLNNSRLKLPGYYFQNVITQQILKIICWRNFGAEYKTANDCKFLEVKNDYSSKKESKKYVAKVGYICRLRGKEDFKI
jgi:hypothetical protein